MYEECYFCKDVAELKAWVSSEKDIYSGKWVCRKCLLLVRSPQAQESYVCKFPFALAKVSIQIGPLKTFANQKEIMK
jgi:hypothetical protein